VERAFGVTDRELTLREPKDGWDQEGQEKVNKYGMAHVSLWMERDAIANMATVSYSNPEGRVIERVSVYA
jgi:hypothetical protein